MQAAQGFYVWMSFAFFSYDRKETAKTSQAVLAKVFYYCEGEQELKRNYKLSMSHVMISYLSVRRERRTSFLLVFLVHWGKEKDCFVLAAVVLACAPVPKNRDRVAQSGRLVYLIRQIELLV